MNKKLILLMLILPLMMMLSIYTSTNTVSVTVKVPVSKIEVAGEKIVYLDLDQNEKYLVNYTVYPVTAANKKIVFTTEKVGNQPLADLEFVDGYIVPKSAGVARVNLTTVDGGYKVSFVVYVESTNVKSIECSVETTELMIGDTTKINTVFYPENSKNKMLSYSSSNDSVATVNNKGIIQGVGKGQATITITSLANNQVVDTIVVNVYNQDIMDMVQTQVYTYSTSGSEKLLAITTDEEYDITFKVYNTNNELLQNSVFSDAKLLLDTDGKSYIFNYTFEPSFVGSVIVKFTITTDNVARDPITKECVFHKVEQILASYDQEYSGALECFVGDWVTLDDKISVTPSDVLVTFDVNDTNGYCEVVDKTENVVIKPTLPGKTTIKLSVISENPKQVFVLEKVLVIKPKYIGFKEFFGDSNIEGIWTIGKYEADGTDNTTKIVADLGYTSQSNCADYIRFTTNNSDVQISESNVVSFNESFTGTVEVDVEAVFSCEGYTTKSSEKLKIRCVGEGYNVKDFKDLKAVTDAGKSVVLQNNVIDDFGYIDTDNDGTISDESMVYTEDSVKKILSTYDTSFYDTTPSVKVLIEFRKPVYGNGYEISAHNASSMIDSTGKYKENALFKGPLDFVSMSESGGIARVKAQDNICFALYDNVSLNNIRLSGCNLLPNKDGEFELNDLVYVGTTVEVLGDNVQINYSRIRNGRTVLRVFGDGDTDGTGAEDIADSSKVIHLDINNSELSNAKEFVIRMGSNCFIDGTKAEPAPYINNDTSVTFPANKAYSSMTAVQKADYDNKFIKTFVKLKDSILKNSGLFCIGVDSHFSGDYLAGGVITNWEDLAKTSYGAKLTMEGQVRIYDWKPVDSVDSSTLIEINGEIGEDSVFNKLKFDLKEMINILAEDKDNTGLDQIVWSDPNYGEGAKYVHGGIAFFGGGKNYSVADMSGCDSEPLVGYTIGLKDVDKELLEKAAGTEKFYFLLKDASSTEFLPNTQDTMTDEFLYPNSK